MNGFESVPNIGKILAAKLKETGINDIFILRSLGSENAFMKLRSIDPCACLDMLYALEGAILNVRWHNLPKENKASLKEFFNNLG